MEAANAAAKHAAENPTAPINKLAKLLKTSEYTGKMIVNFADGFVGTTVRGALANKPPQYNLTGFADYVDRLKHQPLVHLPKLNYTPPAIVWEGSLKNATANLPKVWDIKLAGKNLTAWKAELDAVLTRDDKVNWDEQVDAVKGHAMTGRKLM